MIKDYGTEAFTGRARAYVMARPGYPDEAIEYIRGLAPVDAVFADVGAGTGKLTELIAGYGYEIFAVEPNADMREQLAITLAPFSNARIVDGLAEATTLADHSVDVITCAQTLNRVDIDAFRIECQRISKLEPIVVSLYNYNPDEMESVLRYEKSTGAFYRNPVVKEFSNPIFLTRDKWILYFSSMEGVPRKGDLGYEKHIAEINEIFDRDNVGGVLCLNLVTKVYSEKLS